MFDKTLDNPAFEEIGGDSKFKL